MPARLTSALAVVAALPALLACGSGGAAAGRAPAQGSPGDFETAAGRTMNPRDFVAGVTNAWFPLRPGTTYVWRGSDNGRRTSDVLRVTRPTKRILGVRTTVLDDRAYVEGRLHERTTGRYAQDRDGNVWYFGEATRAVDAHGRATSTAGSWQAGVDGARPGIFMPGRPAVGQVFAQEDYKGHAEDHFRVTSLTATVRVPFVSSSGHAMRTVETTPLEPGVVDAKYYVRGIGTVREATVKGPDKERLDLVSMRRGG